MLVLLGLLGSALAQTDPVPNPTTSLFDSQVPDATITVTKHPMGADMVENTMTKNGYPPQLLDSQVRQLSKTIGSDPRGVQVFDYVLDPTNPDTHFTKATFAVDGIIDRKLGSVRINPLAKIFAGAPKPWTIHALDLEFKGEVPTERMIKIWRSKSAVVEGRYQDLKDPKLAGIEFRVELLSQDPAKLDIPEPGESSKTVSKSKTDVAGTDWTAISVLVVAALACGALVYSLLIRSRPKTR